jgi:hypothetical protein
MFESLSHLPGSNLVRSLLSMVTEPVLLSPINGKGTTFAGVSMPPAKEALRQLIVTLSVWHKRIYKHHVLVIPVGLACFLNTLLFFLLPGSNGTAVFNNRIDDGCSWLLFWRSMVLSTIAFITITVLLIVFITILSRLKCTLYKPCNWVLIPFR